MKRVAIYARVSSTNGTQDYQRQINDLTAFASQNNYEIAKVFAEQVSGAKKNSERPALMELIEFVNTNNIDKVLVTELSRLGRDTLQVLQAIELFNQSKISVFIQNYNIETLLPDGNINPMSQFLITILAEVARMERKTIRERVESGYKNHLANGGNVGRKVGYRKDNEAMKNQYAEDIKLLRKGYSLRNIQKITGTSVNTLRKVKAIV
ncbi:DNA resolvase [Dysgonomonas sp. 521]|uniref:recombinase family protein n=1 Tax=Dysgonomonas sp. 521 TaxID=2302932 RepID=UPI0013D30745|nr:recombinase family protein [Dysgonomonas sp. 521]NDV96939.1 DNA resolvase [Dysgonomonas sp. 521]